MAGGQMACHVLVSAVGGQAEEGVPSGVTNGEGGLPWQRQQHVQRAWGGLVLRSSRTSANGGRVDDMSLDRKWEPVEPYQGAGFYSGWRGAIGWLVVPRRRGTRVVGLCRCGWWGDVPDYPGQPRVSVRARGRGSSRVRRAAGGDPCQRREVRVASGRLHGPGNEDGLQKVQRARGWFSPEASGRSAAAPRSSSW